MRFLQLILAVLVLLGLPACRQLSAALLTQGNHDYQKSDYDRAIQDYNGAIRLDPTFDRAWNDRGAAYFVKGDYDRAIQDLNEAIRLNPMHPSAEFGLARAGQATERVRVETRRRIERRRKSGEPTSRVRDMRPTRIAPHVGPDRLGRPRVNGSTPG